MSKITSQETIDTLSAIKEKVVCNPDNLTGEKERKALAYAIGIVAGWDELRNRIRLMSEVTSPNQDYMIGRKSAISSIEDIMSGTETKLNQ